MSDASKAADLAARIKTAKVKTIEAEQERARLAEEDYERRKTAHYGLEDQLVREYMEAVVAVLTPDYIAKPFENGEKEFVISLWPNCYNPSQYMMDRNMVDRFSSPFLSIDFQNDRREWPDDNHRFWHAPDYFKDNVFRSDYPLGEYLQTLQEQGFTIQIRHSYTEGRTYGDGEYELPVWNGSKLVIDLPV